MLASVSLYLVLLSLFFLLLLLFLLLSLSLYYSCVVICDSVYTSTPNTPNTYSKHRCGHTNWIDALSVLNLVFFRQVKAMCEFNVPDLSLILSQIMENFDVLSFVYRSFIVCHRSRRHVFALLSPEAFHLGKAPGGVCRGPTPPCTCLVLTTCCLRQQVTRAFAHGECSLPDSWCEDPRPLTPLTGLALMPASMPRMQAHPVSTRQRPHAAVKQPCGAPPQAASHAAQSVPSNPTCLRVPAW